MGELEFKLDHVVVSVQSLEQAVKQFQELGFTLVEGGRNGPTHNALIAFEDGTYIELIGAHSRAMRFLFHLIHWTQLDKVLRRFVPPLRFRFITWLSNHYAIRDWCIKVEDIEKAVAMLTAKGIDTSETEKFSRTKPNLEVAEWRLAAPVELRLPFMICDITPIHVRIPVGEAAVHKNGVIGIKGLILNKAHYQRLEEKINSTHGIAKKFDINNLNSDPCLNTSECQSIDFMQGAEDHIKVQLSHQNSEIKTLEIVGAHARIIDSSK